MSQYTTNRIISKAFSTLFMTAFLFLTCCFLYEPTAHATKSTGTSDLVQFTASGHILGFESERMYVASGDHVLRIEFAETDGVRPVADQMPTSDGHTQSLGHVDYPDLWPGITLSYEAISEGIVQSSYRLEPGADVNRIRLRYNSSVEIGAGGTLRIGYENGWMNESAPVAWQEIDGQRITVAVAFSLYNSSTKNPMIGFSLGRYNPAYPLMIDPILSWNTFLGSAADDEAYAIAVDNSGNVYVAGISSATWGPSPVNAFSVGSSDGFVAKLNRSGILQWNTFMGGVSVAFVTAIAVDGSGNVYVAGDSYSTWGSSPVNAYSGTYDAFAAKLNNSGVLQWNTFMGSAALDYAHSIAVDSGGNLYVAGSSQATWGSSPVNAYSGNYDAFTAKLNNSGVLQWNTFMGSAVDEDDARGIAVDDTGNVYVAGSSQATWGSSPVNAYSGDYDAFAAKLNNSGVLQWNTFMGSAALDEANAIAVDGNGNVYVAGTSQATWGSSPVNAYSGDYDAFTAKLNNSGVLQWNTFMGSADSDSAVSLIVDDNGNIYVAGNSDATWGSSPVNPYSGTGNYDGFAAELNNSGVLQWNTFMGSGAYDDANGIAVDGIGNVYVAGISYATWGPSPVNAYSGSIEAFVVRFGNKAIPWIQLLLLDG
ncbi:MAG: SBBP repeat-containing protein [Deltaproteobacteria bacterium]|nr:SBBP repeat-containing protein [Deltaproteobacteria bacterium]